MKEGNIIVQLLRKMLQPLEREVGSKSYEVLAAGAHTDKEFDSIIIGDTACSITVYEEDDADKRTARGLAAASAPAGAYLPAPQGSKITKLTIDQVVVGYNSTL